MNLRKTETFIADVDRQFDWYREKGGWALADRYLRAVEASCTFLAKHPFIGPAFRTKQPRLQGWRFLLVLRPFNKHLLFYEVAGDDLIMRRAMHGSRNLKKRLLEPPTP
jgi:plasmid stabilization system protein ParE